MSQYLAVFGVFCALGVYIFLLFRAWFKHLMKLAQRYELAQRRRLAAFRYPAVVVLFAVPVMSALAWSIRCTQVVHAVVGVFLLAAFAPAYIWWFRHWPSLRALGYGRP